MKPTEFSNVTSRALAIMAELETNPALLRELEFYHAHRWRAACGSESEIDSLTDQIADLEAEASELNEKIDKYESLTGPNLISLLSYAKRHLESAGFAEMPQHFDKAIRQFKALNHKNC